MQQSELGTTWNQSCRHVQLFMYVRVIRLDKPSQWSENGLQGTSKLVQGFMYYSLYLFHLLTITHSAWLPCLSRGKVCRDLIPRILAKQITNLPCMVCVMFLGIVNGFSVAQPRKPTRFFDWPTFVRNHVIEAQSLAKSNKLRSTMLGN